MAETAQATVHDDSMQTPSSVEEMFSTIIQNQSMMFKRVQTLEQKLNRNTKPTKIRQRRTSTQDEPFIAPIQIEQITSIDDFLRFENAIINDSTFKANITKALDERLGNRYTAEDRVSCALMVNRLLFVPDFFKLCSWTGRSKDETQEKFAIQKHREFLEFFNSIIRQSSSAALSEIELKDFFSSRIRNSFYSPKSNIIPTSRKRSKKFK